MDAEYDKFSPEYIKALILEDISGTVETREGSYANTLLSPAAYQLYKIYQLCPSILELAFPNENSGEYIDKRAEDFGLIRIGGTKAQVTLRFTAVRADYSPTVPAGTVALTQNGLRFVTLEDAVFDGLTADVPAEAEQLGRRYNVEADTIVVMAKNIAGVISVTNPDTAYGGTDGETDAELLARWHEFLRRPISSGNAAQYEAWAKEVAGVSHAKTIPLWAGNGTVKVIVGGPDKDPVDDTIVENCAAYIEERRIIGADVTVVSVSTLPIDVEASVTLASGYTAAGVASALSASLAKVLAEMPYGEVNLLRHSRGLALLLDCDGVEDYHSFTLNGAMANITAAADQTLVVGTVTITGPEG